MKYIKTYENINRSQTVEQQKYIKNLARRIEYNVNKYLEGNFVVCQSVDNQVYPIILSLQVWIYDREKHKIINVDVYKNNIVHKALENIKHFGMGYHFSLEQAEKLFSDAKLKFINYELDDTTKSYNL